MVPSVGRDHVVRGLGAAVEPDHRVDWLFPPSGTEPVHDGALAGVAVPQVGDDAVPHSRVFPLGPCRSPGGTATVSAPRSALIVASAIETAGPAAEPKSARSARPSSRSIAPSPRPTVSAMISQTASVSAS